MFVSFYFLIGFFSGVYVGQEHKVPKIKLYLKELQKIVLQIVKNVRVKEISEMKKLKKEETSDIELSSESEEEDTIELETDGDKKED